MSGPEKKPSEFSHAIISYLASIGICVCPCETSPRQKDQTGLLPVSGLFGVPLHLLRPSQHVDGVPEFLVDACELLRPHLHIEGLFRKCGSMIRIKALKARLEAGERCLQMALPCDVATLVKQFLRNLPEPLIPAQLQGSLCQVQQQGREGHDRDVLTLLLTCLLPPRNASIIRYFLTFLQEVVAKCAQNKMDLANLAVIFVPSLFSGEMCSQLGISKTEEQLRSQVAVTQALISRASEIGTIPEPLQEKLHAAISDMESKRQFLQGQEDAAENDTEGRRRRRRSVGNMVTEALSKFKTGRTLCITPDLGLKQESPSSATLKTSFGSKRKASEELAAVTEVSIKKRRSASGSASSDPFDGDGGNSFDQPADITSVQGSPGTLAGKVQWKQNSSRKRPRRKSSALASRSFSPSLIERKQTGHKSLSIFSRTSNDQQPHSLSAKGADPSGWLQMKKRQDAGDIPTSLQQWACLQSYKVQENQRGSPSCSPSENTSAHISLNPRASHDVKSRRPAEPSPCLEVLSSGPSEQDVGPPLGKRGLLAKMEALAETSRQSVAFTMCHKALRRSLSWPEELSLRDAADKIDFSPGKASASPGGQDALISGLAEPAQPGMKAVISGMKQLSLPAAGIALAGSPRAGCSGHESCNLSPRPFPSKPELLEAHGVLAGHFCQTPARLLTEHASSRPDEEPKVGILSPPKHRNRRRFGRSVSHESGLPLQAGLSKGGAPRQSSKTPLQYLKACGRHLFVTRKHIRISFAGLWGRKEVCGPTADSPDQQTSLLFEGDQLRQRRRSPQNPAGEMHFRVNPSCLDV
ncbi:uncharacterized protein PHA67_003503 [Liasis olivaceus]